MRHFFKYVSDAVRRPRDELSRRQHQLRYAWELTAHCWRQLIRHRAEGMAAELTYRTIFSLIPVVVLGLVMFRIVGGLEDVQRKVEDELYSFFGVPDIPVQYTHPIHPIVQELATGDSVGSEPASEGTMDTIEASRPISSQPLPADTGSVPTDSVTVANEEVDKTSVEEASRQQTRAGIRRALREATAKVASLDFASIGVIGLLLFIYAAIALANATESIFNLIFEAPTHRPLHIRVAIHWSIITLGSGLLAISLYLSGQAVEWVSTFGIGADVRVFLSHCLSVVASWVLLFLLYALMPNTHVSVRAAMIGSFIGAILWEAAKLIFQIYVATALPYSALYGSLGLIPLFLFWIYVTWWIFLFGLILTHTLQTLRGRRPGQKDWKESGLLHGDPDWMLPIMVEVAEAFSSGDAVDFQELADRLGLGGSVVHEMSTLLVEAKLLRCVSKGAGEGDALTLARPADLIDLGEILSLAHQSQPNNNHPAWRALSDLKQAECESASGKSLASIMT
ncbi:YihY/virulence factor BrkB family protein [Novipirellula artificiosorum]|uniref:Uncharacterized protein n=1 Tax=Novipirellula artificiosorum TaxID=2528016 RepID=A0A5C6DEN0_9BACT|nr:YihY/virulence factor BrkB family protein [Novipirellula artificiosorum]TWU34384.1 ribonuclease BN/unknown domain fusion protein [Novipirellula artificiosorum]